MVYHIDANKAVITRPQESVNCLAGLRL